MFILLSQSVARDRITRFPIVTVHIELLSSEQQEESLLEPLVREPVDNAVQDIVRQKEMHGDVEHHAVRERQPAIEGPH